MGSVREAGSYCNHLQRQLLLFHGKELQKGGYLCLKYHSIPYNLSVKLQTT